MTEPNESIRLPNGRSIGFQEYGDPQGIPILYFHGTPGSSLEAAPFHQIANEHRCRLIGIDRPGMGLSAFNPHGSLLSWADDIRYFVDSLAINQFYLIGHSGGAPYVVGCAYAMPERVSGAAIISGVGPLYLGETKVGLSAGQRFINQLIHFVPSSTNLMMWLTEKMLRNPNVLFEKMIDQLPEPDKRIYTNLQNRNHLISGVLEAFNKGTKGAAYEMQLLLKPWGFNLEEVKIPFHIWQGTLDKQVPLSHAELYARLIPNSQLTIIDNEAHISVLRNHMNEILLNLLN